MRNGDSFEAKPSMVTWTEEGKDFFGCVDFKTKKRIASNRCPTDAHGISVLDIDNDGFKDVFIVTGADHGTGAAEKHSSAVLLWGQKARNHTVGPMELHGGRDKAIEAGIDQRDASGRFSYWLDVNGDGLYDVVTATEARADYTFAPGRLFIQKPGRKFEMDKHFAEYATSMLLTDLDGDGKVAEMLFVRGFECLPETRAIPDWKERPTGGDDSEQIKDHCENAKPETVAVYDVKDGGLKWRATIGTNRNEGKSRGGPDPPILGDARGLQALDLDGDAIADLAVLRADKLELHLSTERERGELPNLEKPSQVVNWSISQTNGKVLRAADLDLDGQIELVIFSTTRQCNGYNDCQVHRVAARGKDGKWESTDETLGGAYAGIPLQDGAVSKAGFQAMCNYGEKQLKANATLSELFDKTCTFAKDGKADKFTLNGASLVDFSNDGYPDVVVSFNFGQIFFLENRIAKANGLKSRYLTLTIKGTQSNRHGVGASLKLLVKGGNGEERTLLREVNAVSHDTDWLGQRDDRIVFGLGESGEPERLEVRWPSGHVQVIDDKQLLKKKMSSMTTHLVVVEPKQKSRSSS